MIRRGLSLAVTALLLQVAVIEAASLDKETCDKLKTEQSQLEQAGARGNMVKGPDWAKTNLAQDKLDQIKRLIEVEELVLFRCQGKPLVVLPVEAELDPAAKAGETKEEGKGPPAKAAKGPSAEKGAPSAEKKPPAAKKVTTQPAKAATSGEAKPKPKPAASGEAKPKPAASKDATAKKESPAKKEAAPAKSAKDGTVPPAKAAKAKPKTDDAYKPPAPDPTTNPFANQLAPAGKN